MLFLMNRTDSLPVLMAKLDLANCRTALEGYPQLNRQRLEAVIQRAYQILEAHHD